MGGVPGLRHAALNGAQAEDESLTAYLHQVRSLPKNAVTVF